MPEMVQTKACGKCGKPVPSNLTAGDKCPHCGVFFAFDETTGKRSSVPGGAVLGGLVGGSIGFVVWLIRALSRRR
jgi:ribosomal protein S27AE